MSNGVNLQGYQELITSLQQKNITLVAVSKTQPAEKITALYTEGQRDFGENYVQELVDKEKQLPTDIRWHFIGHLQRNKVKQIIGFVHLIHGVDSASLLQEINKQAAKINRPVDVLLQVHIASEETKFGLDEHELDAIMQAGTLSHVHIRGLMGMASFSDDKEQVRSEFAALKKMSDKYSTTESNFNILSMGMSGDFNIAIAAGSNMVRIGSLLFGARG